MAKSSRSQGGAKKRAQSGRAVRKAPRLRMDVIQAILDDFLKRHRKKFLGPDRGMKRLIAALRGKRKREKMSKAG